MRVLSLCSGIGGLDRAVERAFGAELVAYAEVDKAAASVMARHWRGVPNVGDLKTADWSPWKGVDIVCGGIPCQPWSSAGKLGRTEDERHLWPFVADALRVLRPRFLVLEEVPGFLVRGGLDAVLADLCALGFDAEWTTLRASDVGACHRRERLFLVAWDADRPRAHALAPARRSWGATGEPAGSPGAGVTLLPTPAAGAFNDGEDPQSWLARRDELKAKGINGNGAGTPLAVAVKMLPTPTARLGTPRGAQAARYTNPERSNDLDDAAAWAEKYDRWGDYAEAIARHEQVFGRAAPDALDAKRRLSPAFVEWMMDFPPGWCDGLSRAAQLRCFGNGVVTRQAEAALSVLMARVLEEVAA